MAKGTDLLVFGGCGDDDEEIPEGQPPVGGWMGQKEYDEFIAWVREWRGQIWKDRERIKNAFGRMSKVHFNAAIPEFHGIISSEYCRGLRMAARRAMPSYLMGPSKQVLLPISTFIRCEPHVRKALAKPKTVVEVATTKGVVTKALGELKREEMIRVVDPKKGLLKASEQYQRLQQSAKARERSKPKGKDPDGDCYEFEKAIPSKSKPGYLVFVYGDGVNHDMVRGRVKRDMLKKL